MAVVGPLPPSPPPSLLQFDMFLLVWLPSLHVLYIWKMSRSIISPLYFFFFILTKVVVHKYNPFFFRSKICGAFLVFRKVLNLFRCEKEKGFSVVVREGISIRALFMSCQTSHPSLQRK
jgi:hypothetical protein